MPLQVILPLKCLVTGRAIRKLQWARSSIPNVSADMVPAERTIAVNSRITQISKRDNNMTREMLEKLHVGQQTWYQNPSR